MKLVQELDEAFFLCCKVENLLDAATNLLEIITVLIYSQISVYKRDVQVKNQHLKVLQ